jgi:hypothetical protein
MIFFGHVGITVAGVRAADPDADLRAPAIFAVLPDLMDKPAAFLLPHIVHGNTRNFGHSFAGAALVLAFLYVYRRHFCQPLLLWACYLGHFLLDRMWLEPGPTILLWPYLGAFPRHLPGGPKTPYLYLYNGLGEIIGLAILLRLALRHRLHEQERLDDFVRTGRLAEFPGSTIQY